MPDDFTDAEENKRKIQEILDGLDFLIKCMNEATADDGEEWLNLLRDAAEECLVEGALAVREGYYPETTRLLDRLMQEAAD